MIPDEMIKQICVKHGYQLKSIKSGHPDLGAYVYACARELITLARKTMWLAYECTDPEQYHKRLHAREICEEAGADQNVMNNDLVERIRALKVGNVLDFGDYRHNAVIDRIVALIEGAR